MKELAPSSDSEQWPRAVAPSSGPEQWCQSSGTEFVEH